jgi:hypothetical protein
MKLTQRQTKAVLCFVRPETFIWQACQYLRGCWWQRAVNRDGLALPYIIFEVVFTLFIPSMLLQLAQQTTFALNKLLSTKVVCCINYI